VVDDSRDKLRLAASYGHEGKTIDGLLVDVGREWLGRCIPEDVYSATECEPACEMLGKGRFWSGDPPKNLAMAPLVTRGADTFDKNCWEYFGCGEEDCPAFKNPLACWMVKDSCKRRQGPGHTLLDKLEVCKLCDVYRFNHRGRNIGILCVDRGDGGEKISLEDVKSLNVFANSAAAALENIRLMEQLTRDERFIDSIIFNMASGLLVTDKSGNVMMINYAGCEILHTSSELVMGKVIADIFPEVGAMLEVEESPVGHEVGVMTSEGPVPVGYSNSHVIAVDGSHDGVIVVFRDLSDIKAMQEQLRSKERFAAIGRVAAGVAHEIRNPLFGITSVAQIIGREIDPNSEHRALIDAMLSETSRLNTLVEEMLMYGRSTKLSPQPLNLNELLASVLDFYKQMIIDKGVEIVREFCATRPEILADPHQIRQVFLNILVNSLDSVGPGGYVKVRTFCEGDSIATVISDNGVGVPEDDLAKVFDLFYTTKQKGTGLGLPICRKIIEDHGGHISMTSEPGVGTTVRIRLPLSLERNRGVEQ
jgi:PAS domain S-box-containing protein